MIEIPLTQGKVALIDDQDWPLVSGYHWYCRKGGRTFYVGANVTQPAPRTIYLHRLILDAPANMTVDHIDGNGLNNQRANIRLCSLAENSAYQSKARIKTPYRGIRAHGAKWVARLGGNRKSTYLGIFATPEDAARAYDRAAKERYGEFAQLNFR